MNEKDLKNNLYKSVWNMATSIKDVVVRNIVKATLSKDLNIPKESLQRLTYVVQSSVDEAFEGNLRELKNYVEKNLKLLEKEVSKK